MTDGPKWQSDVPNRGSNKSNIRPGDGSEASDGISALIAPTNPGVSADVWERPVPLRPAAAPPLDVDRLGKIAPMAKAVAASLQVPIDLAAWFGLDAVSAAVGGRRYVQPKPDWCEAVTLYTMTICEPGEMKSPSLKAMIAPLFEAEQKQQEDAVARIQEDEQIRRIYEARKKAAEDKAGKASTDKLPGAMAEAAAAAKSLELLGEPIAIPEFFADDATPEALGVKMHEQGERLAILSAEGSFLGNTAGRYSDGNANPELVLKSWGHERHPVDRMGRRFVLKRPSLTVGIAPQPSFLAGLGKSGDVFEGRGLFARFLLFVPISKVGTRDYDSPRIPANTASAYGDAIKNVVENVWADDEYKAMTLDEKAQKLFRDFWNDFEARHKPGGDLVGIEAWAKKFPGQLLRIAALITILDEPMSLVISGAVMEDVISLVPYLVSHMRHAVDLMSAAKQSMLGPARDIFKWIERCVSEGLTDEETGEVKPFTEFSTRDAFNGVHNRTWAREQGMEAVNNALQILEERFYVRRQPPPETRGRGRPPAPRYDISPYVLSPQPGSPTAWAQ